MRIKKYIKRALLGVAVLAAMLLVWQLYENHKFRGVLLPEGAPYAVPAVLPAAVRDRVADNRAPYLTKMPEAEVAAWWASLQYRTYLPQEDAWISAAVAASRASEAVRPRRIPLEEALADLDYLAGFTKYASAHYTYYGGDEVFLPVWEALREQVAASCRETGGMEVDALAEMLQTAVLWVMRDQHSYVDGMRFQDRYPTLVPISYTGEALLFDQDHATVIDGERMTLLSADGEAPSVCLKPTILPDGAVAYVLWFLSDQGRDGALSCTLTLRRESGEQVRRTVRLPAAAPFTRDAPVPYRLTEENGYQLLVNSTLQPEHKKEFRRMEREAAGLRGTDTPLVVDLRQHQGGWDLYGLYWMMRYLNVSKLQLLFCPLPDLSLELQTGTTLSVQKGRAVSPPAAPGLVPRAADGGQPLHLKNNRPIYILTDRGVGSSGEWLLSYLRRMDNVVIVGENTMGLLIGGNTMGTRLPHSRIRVGYSSTFNMDSHIADLEGVGFTADLYVPPAQALERVAALIQSQY